MRDDSVFVFVGKPEGFDFLCPEEINNSLLQLNVFC
jgi:hypothetical protein